MKIGRYSVYYLFFCGQQILFRTDVERASFFDTYLRFTFTKKRMDFKNEGQKTSKVAYTYYRFTQT